MGFYVMVWLLLFGFKGICVDCIDTAYLDTVCDVSVSMTTSRRLESSTALHYDPNTACYYHVTVDAGKTILLINRYFRLEAEVNGACVDFVNIHDGSSTSAATLNASPLCDEMAATNYTSTGTDMTIYFQTDATGSWRGFDFVLVAITTGVCSSDQFSCNTSVCIDASLHCSQNNECGDSSDETGCTYATPPGLSDDNAVLIIGLLVGLLAGVTIAVIVGVSLWRYNRWRMFEKRPITAREVVLDETTFGTTYPVSKIYYQERYQNRFRNPEAPLPAAYTSKTKTTTLTTRVTTEATNEAFVPE